MTFTVDVHHHILPDFFWQATNEAHGPVGGIAPAHWSAEGAEERGPAAQTLRRDLAVRSRVEVAASLALNEAEREAVLSQNATKLFPRWTARTTAAR
jgi:hypothetical protein